jgi:hypothetical protein
MKRAKDAELIWARPTRTCNVLPKDGLPHLADQNRNASPAVGEEDAKVLQWATSSRARLTWANRQP